MEMPSIQINYSKKMRAPNDPSVARKTDSLHENCRKFHVISRFVFVLAISLEWIKRIYSSRLFFYFLMHFYVSKDLSLYFHVKGLPGLTLQIIFDVGIGLLNNN